MSEQFHIKKIKNIINKAGPSQLINIKLFYTHCYSINIKILLKYLFDDINSCKSKEILSRLKLYEFFLDKTDSFNITSQVVDYSIKLKVYKSLYKLFKHNPDKIIRWTTITLLRRLNYNSSSYKITKYINKAKIINQLNNLDINFSSNF